MSTTSNYIKDSTAANALMPTTTINTNSTSNLAGLAPTDTSVFVTNDFGSIGCLQPGVTTTSTTLNGSSGTVNPNNYITSNFGAMGNFGSYGNYPTRQANETDEAYQARVQQYQIQQIENNAALQTAQTATNIKTTAGTNALTNEIKQLANLVNEGDTDEAKEKLESIVSDFKNTAQYKGLNDKEIMAIIEQQYPNLEKDIEEKCSGGFGNALKSTLTLGICGQKTSKDELLAYIRGTSVKTKEKAAAAAGSTAGGAATGAAIGAAAGSIIPGAGTAAGAVVGGIIGGIGGFVKSLIH